jgi:hypothetical protein
MRRASSYTDHGKPRSVVVPLSRTMISGEVAKWVGETGLATFERGQPSVENGRR